MNKNSNVENSYSEDAPILGKERRQCCLGCPKRWMLSLLGFTGFLNVYAMRVNLSVAMVAMVRRQYRLNDTGSTIACLELLKHESNSTSNSVSDGDFDWDSSTQALILGSFFYGYVITQFPGGYLAQRYGAKWLYGIGVFITSVFTLLTPYAAFWGVWPLVIVRIIEGLGEGVTFPAMNTMIGRWAPKNERTRIATLIFNGIAAGNVISFSLSGIISDTMGWPYVFYIFGTLGIIWTFFWLFLVHETPETHPCITEEEIKHIREGQDPFDLSKPKVIPWKAILTSRFMWAMVVTHFGQNWGFYTLLTEMPTYLAEILHFDIRKNGLITAFSYFLQGCLAIISSLIADRMRFSGQFRINTIRKWFNSIAFFSPALCLAAMAFVSCNSTAIIALLAVAVGLNGFNYSGYSITLVDMSPDFAGTMMGIMNCIGNFPGFLAPAFVGFVVQNGQTLHNWGIVFTTAAVTYVLAGLVYIFFCTAELQPWGTVKKKPDAKNEDNTGTIIFGES